MYFLLVVVGAENGSLIIIKWTQTKGKIDSSSGSGRSEGVDQLLPQTRGDTDMKEETERKEELKKRAAFQRHSLPETTHLRPTVCACVFLCIHEYKNTSLCMHMCVDECFSQYLSSRDEMDTVSCVCLVLRSLIFCSLLFP